MTEKPIEDPVEEVEGQLDLLAAIDTVDSVGNAARDWARVVVCSGAFSTEQLLLVWCLTSGINEHWESDCSLDDLVASTGLGLEEVKAHLEILREGQAVAWHSRVDGEVVATPFTLNQHFPERRPR